MPRGPLISCQQRSVVLRARKRAQIPRFGSKGFVCKSFPGLRPAGRSSTHPQLSTPLCRAASPASCRNPAPRGRSGPSATSLAKLRSARDPTRTSFGARGSLPTNTELCCTLVTLSLRAGPHFWRNFHIRGPRTPPLGSQGTRSWPGLFARAPGPYPSSHQSRDVRV